MDQREEAGFLLLREKEKEEKKTSEKEVFRINKSEQRSLTLKNCVTLTQSWEGRPLNVEVKLLGGTVTLKGSRKGGSLTALLEM